MGRGTCVYDLRGPMIDQASKMCNQTCQSVTAIMMCRVSKCSSSPTEVVSYSRTERSAIVTGEKISHTFGPYHVVLLLRSQELGGRGEVYHHYSQRLSGGVRFDQRCSYRRRRESQPQRSHIPRESASDQNDFVVNVQTEHTKIQDHPNFPAVPLMKDIP